MLTQRDTDLANDDKTMPSVISYHIYLQKRGAECNIRKIPPKAFIQGARTKSFAAILLDCIIISKNLEGESTYLGVRRILVVSAHKPEPDLSASCHRNRLAFRNRHYYATREAGPLDVERLPLRLSTETIIINVTCTPKG